MTELQVYIVKSLLLLIGLAYCQGPSVEVPDVCIVRGEDFHSRICQATSDNSLLYFKVNDTDIDSDAKAAALGFNISLDHDGTGRMYRTFTANNMQNPMTLVCIENLPVPGGREMKEILSDSIRVEDKCPPSVTGAGNGYDSLNMTNATSGPPSSEGDGIITAAVVTVLVVTVLVVTILVIVAIVGLLVYYYRRRSRPLPNNNNDLDGHSTNLGAGDGLPLDEINPPPPHNHQDNGGPSSPVVPEDKTDSTMFTNKKPSKRSPPRLDVSRVMESGSEASPACEPTVDFKVQGINAAENSDPSMEVRTAAEQCTDEGGMPRTYCYGDEIHVNMKDSYENPTYCVNPARSQGREEISPV